MYQHSTLPGSIIGYRKNGQPIRLIAGGDPTVDPENPGPTPVTVPVATPTFTQEQVWAAVEAARTEEKSKLYGRLDKADEALKTLTTERDERLAAVKAAEDAEAARLQAAEDEKLTLKQRFEKSEAEHAAQLKAIRDELAQNNAILAKEREYAELNEYRMGRLAELAEPDPEKQHYGIMPELRDLIGGSTKEEIEASLTTMVAKTRSIVEGVQQHEISSRAAMPGVSPTAGNFGPIEQSGSTKTYSAEEINAMAPGSKEHMELRAARGIGRASSNRGIFG